MVDIIQMKPQREKKTNKTKQKTTPPKQFGHELAGVIQTRIICPTLVLLSSENMPG